MARNTSIVIGDYYENFINKQIESGKYNSVSEVIRTALRYFEIEEAKKQSLIKALELGERSGNISNFDRSEHLRKLNEDFNK
jgi:antitoxin ParD1/3/4